MEFLQSLAEVVLAQIQLKIYDRQLLKKYFTIFDTELFGKKEMTDYYQNLLQKECMESVKYKELLRLCGETEAGRWLLDCCITALLYPEFLEFAFEKWNGITLDAVSGMCEQEAAYKDMKKTAECAERILKCQKKQTVFLRYSFFADVRLLDYFLDEYSIDNELKRIGATLFTGEEKLQETFISKEVQEQLENILKKEDINCVHITGGAGTGKKFLLKKACKKTGIKMLMIDMDRLRENKTEELVQYANLVIREGLLLKSAICFYHVNKEELEQTINLFFKPILEQNIKVFVCTLPDVEIIARMDCHVEKVAIPTYGRNERIALWQGFTKSLGIYNQVDCITAGAKFKLSAKEINKATERIARSGTKGYVSETEISRICEEVLFNPTCGNIKRIHVQYTLDDLKLLPEQKIVLNNICSHVWHRHKVYDEWNMDSRYSYGKNVSALFYGPPGTGKTMAVHVIANMLKLPLYRIELSQVVDKYIGETEKRLEEIFDAAEKNNTVLFLMKQILFLEREVK
ncbi:MAG: AAA family ATPase [Lachnospiraceae bacterium]|nr:AAA family ATPase [Lachnospiraceae bacterium]